MHAYMASVRVNSLLSKSPSVFVSQTLDIFYDLVGAFQRVTPAVQHLRSLLQYEEDVRVKHQYQALCRSLKRGAEQTLVFIDLMGGVLSLRRDEERRERIIRELEAAISGKGREGTSSSESESATRKEYPQLVDFETEFRIRLEGVKKEQGELVSLCQQMERENGALSGMILGGNCKLMSVWMTRNVAFSALALGTLLLGIGITEVNPKYSRWLFGLINIPFGIAFLACLGFCCKTLSAKYSTLEKSVHTLKEAVTTLNSMISEITSYAGRRIEAVMYKSAPVSDVKVAVDSFFMERSDLDHIERSKTELHKVIGNLQNCMMQY